MAGQSARLTGIERRLGANDIVVSKTDPKGRITYANQTFLAISGFREDELLGTPHNIVRHPDMPRAIFKLLWERLLKKHEVFAYVVNRSKNGDHYWVLAHVTPTFDETGSVVGYHSARRQPDPLVVERHISPLYRSLLAEEQKGANPKDGLQAGFDLLMTHLKEKGIWYDEFVFSLQGNAA